MAINANEIAATRSFSQSELRAWMDTRSTHGNEVSPWFAVMEKSGLLYKWWDAALQRKFDGVLQRGVIHRAHDLEALAAGVAAAPMPTAFSACIDATYAAALARASGQAKPAPAAASPAAAAARPVVVAGSTRAASRGASSQDSPSASPQPTPSSGDGKAGTAAVERAGSSARSSSSPVPLVGAAAATAAAVEEDEAVAIPGASVGGSAGRASPAASASAQQKQLKQGAYGKVPIHSESTLSQLSHLDEVWAALLFKAGATGATRVAALPADAPPCRRFCERMLARTSRSFAMVIQQLPPHLRASVCVFYLVLRGLDTVEDDMVAFKGREAVKLAHLRAFHTYLTDPYWHLTGVGEHDEAALLAQFFGVNGEVLQATRTWSCGPKVPRLRSLNRPPSTASTNTATTPCSCICDSARRRPNRHRRHLRTDGSRCVRG